MSSLKFVPPVIAHRGANNLAPENTLAAFSRAKEQGANWVEFDVMLSADGEAVVIHDETLERTTSGTGLVSDHPYSYLKSLDAGSWFGKDFSEQYIPTFKEVIEIIRRDKLSANVEIKSQPGSEEQAVKKILNDIAAYWRPDMQPPLISSFSMEILRYVSQYSKDALIGILVDDWFEGWAELAEEYRCSAVNLNHEILNRESVKAIKYMGKLILCYTVNDPERALELYSWGVDAVFTDNVGIILRAL